MQAGAIIPFIVAIVMAAAVITALGYPYIQAKLSVVFAGGLVLILALVQLARELRSGEVPTSKVTADLKEVDHGASTRQYFLEATWLVAFGLVIHLMGFMVAIPLFICLYMKTHGTKWSISIIVAVLMAVCSYVMFSLILGIDLYPGKIPTYLDLW